ncbi:uncharacterized protein BJ212DRAFT_992164 [Suillus subaureus]|uniref:Uncharacterized protein n=1 Tax=Suillus subaureus TaxID=48587 RepID=A0A9P7DUD3_9AGAM|nr:uncharacterized protein BJ212DRAFT_992164 [Suillus subaureus]KAG1803188.1 hypothetical protein BJ212DRAFT_992164 [Suillus subaureus]
MGAYADREELTLEEELLYALLDANEVLIMALRMYDDVIRVAEESVAFEISSRDLKMDPRRIEMEYLGQSHHHYGGGSSRTPSPISPPTSRTPSPHTSYTPSPPTSLRQLDPPLVVPSQTHFLPRLSPAHSHYGPPPPYRSTSALLAPPPPPPLGPRSHICLPHPLLPTPLPPPYNTSLITEREGRGRSR